MVKTIFQLMRPHQYVKNFFIFLPQFFGLKINDTGLLLQTSIVFAAFSLAASSVYIFNDYRDMEDDKNHPQKKERPLASGKVSRRKAVVLMILLALAGLAITYLVKFEIFLLTLAYYGLNILYSIKLKHIPILDVFIIAFGFVLRLFIGAQVCNVSLSMWIILMTFLLALFLAFAKRRDDVLIFMKTGEKARKVIDGYNEDLVNYSMSMMASVVIVSYIMYTISPSVMAKSYGNKAYLTVIWVILGILRYMQLTFVQSRSGSPTRILFKDLFIQLVLAGWVVTFGVLMYL